MYLLQATPPRPAPLWSTRLYSKSPTVPLIPVFTVPELRSCTGIRGERRCLPLRISGAILICPGSHRFKASRILVPTKPNLFRTKLFFFPCFVIKIDLGRLERRRCAAVWPSDPGGSCSLFEGVFETYFQTVTGNSHIRIKIELMLPHLYE